MSSNCLVAALCRRLLLRRLAFASCLTLSAPLLHAQLVWDANALTAGQPNGSGQWFGANQWYNGSANVNWDNSGSVIAQMGTAASALVNPNTVTITSGTANVGGMIFMPFTASPGTSGQQYTIAGSSGTLNFAANSTVTVGDLTSTGSNFITFATSLLVTGNGLSFQKAAGSTAQQFMRFDMTSNPGLTGTLTIKGSGGGLFFRSGSPSTFSAVSSVVVETDSCFSMVGPGTYNMPMSIAGTGGNGGYGAIRVDTTGTTLAGPITLTADASLQTNTGGVTNTIVSGGISGGFGFGRFATGSGQGTLSFTTANTYTGTTTLGRAGTFAGGVTILDFSAGTAPTDNILYNGAATPGALNMIGGNNSSTVLQLNGKAGVTNSQSFGNLTLNQSSATASGTAVISLTSGTGGQMNLSLGTITRSGSMSTLAFVAPVSGTITSTQADGFLGPWATFKTAAGAMTWARVTSNVVGAFSSDLKHLTGENISAHAGYSSASHLEVADASTGNVTVAAGTTNLATLTMNDQGYDRTVDLAGQTLRLGSTGTTSVGGVLMTSDSRNLTIGVPGSAGTLTSGGPNNNTAGQLFLTNGSNSSTLTVNSVIANNGSGAVTLFINGNTNSKVVLSGTNTFSGGTQILSGSVEMKNAAALGTTGTVVLMEGAAIQLGGGVIANRTLTAAGNGVGNTGAIRNIAGNNSWTSTITATAPLRFHSDSGTLTLTHSSGAASNMVSGTHNVIFSGSGNIVLGSRLNTSSGTVTKEGTGMLTVSGDGGTALTGATAINGGVLRLTTANGLGNTSLITVADASTGAALELSGGITVANAVTFNGSGINGVNNLNGSGAIRNIFGNNTLSGIVGIGLDAAGPRVSADADTTLTLSGTIRSAATLAGTRIGLFGGAGTINVTGVITNGTTASTYITGIAKIESGTLNIRTASTFTPNTTAPTTSLVNVRGGTLNLDYANASVSNGLILGTNNLTMGGGTTSQGGNTLGGGTLLITGKAGTANVQNFASTTLAGGRSAITALSGSGGSMNLALGPITRANSSGSAVMVTLPATGSITTTTLNSNGILNGGMTVGQTTWATSAATQSTNVAWADTGDTITLGGYTNGQQVSFSGTAPAGLTAGLGYYVVNATAGSFQLAATEGGAAIALTNSGTTGTMNTSGAITGLADASYSSTFATNANVDVAGGAVSQAAITINSMRFNAAGGTVLSLTGSTFTNTSGGILITPNVTGDVTIQSNSATVRSLAAGTPVEFTVHHHGSGVLNLASTVSLSNATAFTKVGQGTMNFAGTAAAASVQIRATEGTLNFVGSSPFTSSSDPTLFFGSATTGAKVSFGNGAATGSESFAGLFVLGNGSSLVGGGSGLYTIGLQSGLTTDLRALMIGGAGTNENNLNFEAYSGGATLMGAANTYAGRTNLGRATIEATVLANAGTASSIGTGSLSPDIVMHDTSSTAVVLSTLRYVGSADATTDRAIKLFTDGATMPSLTGVVENNGTGSLKFTSAFKVEGNTNLARTFRLGGTNTGANEIVSIGQTATSVLTLDKAGTGTWALTGNSTYTGGTTVSNGTLQLGNGGSAGNVGTGGIAISSGAILRTNRSDTLAISQNITGAGSVFIANPAGGITQLSSSLNTYSGGTTVASGVLMAANTSGSATGSGGVTVMTGATLGGSGRIAPALDASVTILGTLSVGALPSTASAMDILTGGAGSLIIDGSGELVFDLISGAGLGDNTGSAASADLLRVGGTMTLNAGAKLTISGGGMSGWAAGDQWKLIDWSTLTGSTATTFTEFSLPELSGGLMWDVSQIYSLGTVSIMMVPEPSRMLVLAAGLLCVLGRRRRACAVT